MDIEIRSQLLEKIYEEERAAIIIKKAKENYPASYSFTGSLTEDQAEEIKKECDIRTSSVYMNGTSRYCIRYRNEKETNERLTTASTRYDGGNEGE